MNNEYYLYESYFVTKKRKGMQFLTEHTEVYKLFIASKAAGIYGCQRDCTFRMMENPNLLLNYTRFLLLDDKMQDCDGKFDLLKPHIAKEKQEALSRDMMAAEMSI